MPIPKDFAEALDTHLELAGKLLDQASVFKERIDDLERHQEKVNFEHKMAFFAMRERYAKAMLHLHHKLELIATKTFYDVNGDIVTDKNAKCVKHIPKDWMVIWQWVYHKVHKHLKKIRLQYYYGRNPAQITTSRQPTIIVNKD